MLKAVFMDFYGTAAYEVGPAAMKVIQDIYENSSAGSPREVTGYWWKVYGEMVAGLNGPEFRTQHEVGLDTFRSLVREFQCTIEPEVLLAGMERHWSTTPVYEDVIPFMEKVSLPVWFVTNSDDRYVMEDIRLHGLKPAGVVTSEQARYSKPRKEIFLYALEKAGLAPDEVIHIGDSLDGDVRCPGSVGIRSIWLNREGKPVPEGVESAENLLEAMKCLERIKADM